MSLVVIVGGAVFLIVGFVFALYCRLRAKRKTHRRINSGMDIAVEDDDMDMDMDVEVEEDLEMVHTGYGCVQPGRTDEISMLAIH